MSETSAIAPEAATVLAEWAGLEAGGPGRERLAEIFQAFQERARRLYAVDVTGVEFAFLHPVGVGVDDCS